MAGGDDQSSTADSTGFTGQAVPSPREAAALARTITADLGARYELREYLGRGAFATVWKVFDRIAGEVVAVKRFDTRFADGAGFYRELRALFLLRHERIVRVINLAEAANGARHLVLEYCEGGSLRPAISRARRAGERCPPARARILGLQLAEGLAAAHRQGLVHRDLKPENVLFETLDPRPFGGHARIKLADFGLARALSTADARANAGVLRPLSGSPAYMAPEQFDSTYHQASDVYALGVILYELLHGQAPFQGTAAELAYQHLRQPPVIDPALPDRWRTLLIQLLDKAAQQRPTAAELIEILGRRETDRRRHPARAGVGVFARLAAPASALIVDSDPQGSAFVAATAHGLQRFDGRTGEPRARLELPGLRSLVRGPEGGLWLAAKNQVLRLDHSGAAVPVQRVDLPIETLAACDLPDGMMRIAVASGDQLVDYQPPEGQRWARPLPTHGLRPFLLRLADGRLVASDGPLNPRLLVLDLNGSTAGAVALPGICWQLGAWPDGDRLFALVLVDNVPQPYRIDLARATAEALPPVADLLRLTAAPFGSPDLFGLCGNGDVVAWRADGVVPLFNLNLPGTTFKGLATDGAAVAVLCRSGTSWWIQFRTIGDHGR